MDEWLRRRVLNVAHQGGDHEAPSNTLYAFHTAARKGAHMLEIDVHATADGHVVVCHDPTIDRTTNGSGAIEALTLSEIASLDAAYRFVPGEGPSRRGGPWPLRGIATNATPAPDGFTADDFKIPTLEQVLERLTDLLVSIDIKRGPPATRPYEEQVAELIERYDAVSRVVVASFDDEVLKRFRSRAPHVATSAATLEAMAFVFGGGAGEYRLLQLPFEYEGTRVVTRELVDRAHEQGLAMHVWTVNDRATMEHLLQLGVDGIVTDRPSVLADLLAEEQAGPIM